MSAVVLRMLIFNPSAHLRRTYRSFRTLGLGRYEVNLICTGICMRDPSMGTLDAKGQGPTA